MATRTFSKEQTILLAYVAEDNPRGEGTKRAKAYELYKSCATVGEFLEAGGRRRDIIRDQQQGLIVLDSDQFVPPKQRSAKPATPGITKVRSGKVVSAAIASKPVTKPRKAVPTAPWPFAVPTPPVGAAARKASRKPGKVAVATQPQAN